MIPKVNASMLEHRSPFDSLRESRGGHLADEPGLRATPAEAGFLLLQSTPESRLQDALTSEIGLGLPAPQEASVRGDYALLWLTPSEWLLELPAKEADSVQIALTHRLAASLATVTDMSDAFACCEVSGARAAEALMSGCSLNLHAHAFPSGRVARTALADIPIIIRKVAQPHDFRCLVDRGFAGHFRDWLADAARNQRAAAR
jgi:heterotetrameric sarcosine oxidase gamma subunit